MALIAALAHRYHAPGELQAQRLGFGRANHLHGQSTPQQEAILLLQALGQLQHLDRTAHVQQQIGQGRPQIEVQTIQRRGIAVVALGLGALAAQGGDVAQDRERPAPYAGLLVRIAGKRCGQGRVGRGGAAGQALGAGQTGIGQKAGIAVRDLDTGLPRAARVAEILQHGSPIELGLDIVRLEDDDTIQQGQRGRKLVLGAKHGGAGLEHAGRRLKAR